MEYIFWAMDHGPYWDHVLPIFTSRSDKALNFSRLSYYGQRCMAVEQVLFETMPGPCLALTGTMFCLSLLPDHIDLINNVH